MRSAILLLLLFKIVYCNAQSEKLSLKNYEKISNIIDSNMESHPEKVLQLVAQQKGIAAALQMDSLRIDANMNEAEALFNLGFYDECLQMRYAILSDLEKTKPDRRIGETQLQTAWVYFELEDFKRYIEFAENAKKSFIAIKNYPDTIRCNTEIGLGHVMLGNYKKGLDLLIQSKGISKKYITDTFQKMIIFDNLSLAYTQMGDHQNALISQLDVEKNRHKVSPIYYTVASYEHLSEKYLAVENYAQANHYADLAIKYGKQYNNLQWLFSIYQNKANILNAQKKYKEAFDFLQLATDLKDSIQTNDYNIKMSIVANKYELEKKQSKIALLSKDKILADTQIQRLSLGLVALLLSALATTLYFVYRKNKKEKILKEKFAQQLLNVQEEERQRIAKDLHDSVGQNILFIKNQLLGKERDDEKLLLSVNAALDEVRNISKDLYPNQLEKYGLASAVNALSEQISKSTNIFVSSDLQNIDEALNKNVQINLYRIIQEFVNNTLKHANATAIRITSEQTPSEIKLVVQDNGKGFNVDELSKTANTSFGILNMEERIKMLKGHVEVESEIGKGTKGTFTIPI